MPAKVRIDTETVFSTGTIAVGATIQIPLHNQTAKANLATARIQGEQLTATIQSTEHIIGTACE